MSIGQVAERKMTYVYILQSRVNSRYYIGSTNNIARRLEEHNKGRGRYTRLTKPFELIFLQKYNTLADARRVEYKLKKLKSRSVISKIIEDGYIKIKPQ